MINFVACEPQFDGATVLSFFQGNADEAYNRIHNLLAFLRFTNPPEFHLGITNSFSASAQEAASHVVWDPDSKMVITQADMLVQDIVVDDAALDGFLGCDPELQRRFIMDLRGLKPDDESSATKRPAPDDDDDDDDSVSTFKSGNISAQSSKKPRSIPAVPDGKPAAVSQPTRPSRVAKSKKQDDVSMQSEITLESAVSRISQLEDNVLAMRSEFREVHSLLRNIAQSHSASAPSHENTGAGPSL